ncbi:2-succinyl-6-hydroxy-2,4-cyclohexadiene-1-carboxylate synthase [Salmonella enterica subsp. enterica serovar Choleraesuis]|nr:2-succinyl-6-hydroxy-2,4-cyclohexadiene-1-carboxylate synthase [Salmonella enterica subsp. enterica serovar Choleraesuis]
MTLQVQVRNDARREGPWLVWLHGFLGSHAEWQDIAENFPEWPQLFIDLPGHGGAPAPQFNGFKALSEQLSEILNHYQITDYWLVGYSLGGRLAMYHACHASRPPCGLVIEGGNPGLENSEQRVARLAHDERWAQRFESEALEQVLDDWYQQPVFAHLNATQRHALVRLRAKGDSQALAQMLRATSLGLQPDLRPLLAGLSLPFYYFYGARDTKFAALAAGLPALSVAIPAAGHNAHRENPMAFSERLLEILHHSDKEQP